MTTVDLSRLVYRKSSKSSNNGGCVEVAPLPDGGAAVRDTKDRGKLPFLFDKHEWDCFIDGVKTGEFDF